MSDQKRIAVVAVHGISDPLAGSSVKAIANLLLNLEQNNQPVYSSFLESTIRIQSKAIRFANDPPKNGPFRKWAKQGQLNEAHAAFLKGQIECYQGEDPDDPYETIRLEGAREANPCRPQVHLYEMHWADLSRFGGFGLRVLGEIYQILLHLPSVGVHTLHAAGLDDEELGPEKHRWSDRFWWNAMTETHAGAAWLLQVPAAVLNLLLLALALGLGFAAMLAKMPNAAHASILTIALAAGLTFGACLISYGRERPPIFPIAVGLFITGLAAVGFFYWPGRWIPPEKLLATSLILTTLMSLAGVFLVAKGYSRMRHDAMRWFLIFAAIASVATVASVLWRSPVPVNSLDMSPLLILLRAMEIVFVGLSLVWLALYGMIWIVEVLGWKFLLKRKSRLASARRTARLTLALSSFFFVVLTVVLWTGIVSALSPLVPPSASSQYPANAPLHYRMATFDRAVPAPDMGWILVVESSILPGANGIAALLALLIVVCGLAPMVRAETSPPRNADSTPQASKEMGQWLSQSNRSARWSGRLMFMTLLAAFPATLYSVLWGKESADWLRTNLGPLVVGLGGVVAGGAVGVFALSRTFKNLAGLLAPLDALLDVDNYMRENPRETNPTARIFGRFLSLLRYIQNGSYDALVVVSHSQGTVITTDLLRFLLSYPSLSGFLPPIFLFTMGCPLRNLYGTFFPHLYKWAAELPKPADVGVVEWVNAYRSGDYVGRYLWRDPARNDHFDSRYRRNDQQRLWDLNTEFDPNGHPADTGIPSTRELCIGAGAHTHYWDETAPEIAYELDRLIQRAAGCARQ